jgi:hypothetical protein
VDKRVHLYVVMTVCLKMTRYSSVGNVARLQAVWPRNRGSIRVRGKEISLLNSIKAFGAHTASFSVDARVDYPVELN